MKPLNECVLREIHPPPKVDETLAQLSWAKIISTFSHKCNLIINPCAARVTVLGPLCLSVRLIILANRPTFCGTVPQKSVGLLPRFLQPRAKRQRKSDTILTLPYPFCGDLVNPHPFIPEFYNHNPSVVLQGIPRGTTRVEISHRNQLGEFAMKSVKFLGHIVNGVGITAAPDKITGIVYRHGSS